MSKTHSLLRRAAELVLGDSARVSPEHMEMSTRLVTLNLLAVLLIPCFMAEYLLLGHHVLIAGIGLAGMVMLCSLPIYRMTMRLAWARDAFVFSLFAFKVGETLYLGTLESPGVVWFTTMPVIGVLLGGTRAGTVWLAITLSGVGAIFLVQELENLGSPLFWAAQFFAFSLACVVVALFIFVLMAELGRRKAVRGLEAAHDHMRQLAERDGLTGLFNRRYVWQHLKERQAAEESASSVLLIDVDHFKAINDTLGHMAGDDVLRDVAQTIAMSVPDGSIVGRYGGEEFVVVLQDHGAKNTLAIAEQVRRAIAKSTALLIPGFGGATVSVGIADLVQSEPFSNALDRADRALYLAKNSGRNNVAGSSDLTEIRLAG